MKSKQRVDANDIYTKVKADVVKFAIETAKKTNKKFIPFKSELFYKKYGVEPRHKLASALDVYLSQDGLIQQRFDHQTLKFIFYIDLELIRKTYNIK